MRKLLLACVLLLSVLPATGQSGKTARDFYPARDSLKARLLRRTGVWTNLQINKVSLRGNILDFHFSQELSDYPWRTEDIEWFRDELRSLMPESYRAYALGEIYGKKTDLNTLPMPLLKRDGTPTRTRFRVKDPRDSVPALVRDGEDWPLGLSGRHIALWQSHGRYYEAKTGRWEWQRAPTHGTVEDLYTQSYVLPFLIPMLENAGACVMTPRERDPQAYEVVCDNDPSFEGPREGMTRRCGRYRESGEWEDAGPGFADTKPYYLPGENPFLQGTARRIKTLAPEDEHRKAEITWRPDIPEAGDYAVYVSYKTIAGSTTDAVYSITHKGGTEERHVNQQMGGGTWIYLGTFPFDAGTDGCVRLSNRSSAGGYVTADAVRFGGGMGKVIRGEGPSGMPAYREGAIYNLQWSGMDASLFEEWEDDYKKDYSSRGKWVSYLGGGSRTNPAAEGRRIPFDLSLAFHSDAGVTPNDSIVGTLAIYTLLCEGKDKFPNGEDRLTSRMLTDLVQTQVVEDIRRSFEPRWTRRQTWDRSYSESRTTGVPAVLLESLSHQNFADMRYGLDPSFRFAVSRAVYKGVLKYLSNRYGCPYAVQPLPVQDFSVSLSDGKAILRWTPREDLLEPTAQPEGYIVYSSTEDGAFEEIARVALPNYAVPLVQGRLTRFRVVAWNRGGKSFPSETLAAGVPSGSAPQVLVVNNFTRVSAPAWFDSPGFAGFQDRLDSGVPYLQDLSFVGSVNEFDRSKVWTDDDNPGFGGSYTDRAGAPVGGNTFDYPAVHGKALLENGYAFASASASALPHLDTRGYKAIDLICGKQVTTPSGRGAVPCRYQVFPPDLRAALEQYAAGGGALIVSGAYIGTDAWDRVYPVPQDPVQQEAARTFIQKVFGYKWITNFGDRSGLLLSRSGASLQFGEPLFYHRELAPDRYHVENPDGIAPASEQSQVMLLYGGGMIPAATLFDDGTHRAAAFGFPLEALETPEELSRVLNLSLKYLLR